ncbi:MAG: hypothetical protein P1T08_01105 [Acidimicrobiia bacterium]|nr:hypothetical protein [Acidimicrobiia bacterium]
MAEQPRFADHGTMIKKVILWVTGTAALLALLTWNYTYQMDRRMDSTVLAEVLERTPIPTEDLVLVDQWNIDGSWLLEKREPEAVRKYVAVGAVDEVCSLLDGFYGEREIQIRPTSRSDNPVDWCGRSIRLEDTEISVWVEPVKSWTKIPEHLIDEPELVVVDFSAYRR